MKTAGLYIHIPFCKVKCVYCDFYSITKKEDHDIKRGKKWENMKMLMDGLRLN